MIIYKTGNIFNSDADYFVNPVNLMGTSGKGLALEVKRRYPQADKIYQAVCKSGEFNIGDILQVPTDDHKFVLFFPTKKHWRDPSEYEYIERGLDSLKYHCKDIPKNSIIAIPQLGCGLGGLEWSRVHGLILEYLKDVRDITFYVYGPNVGGKQG
nr:MAG TPA: hypothetical protein [Caudoviricetes sp.]